MSGKIIDGAVYDAKLQAASIVAAANTEAAQLVAAAKSKAAEIVADAATWAVEQRAKAAAPPTLTEQISDASSPVTNVASAPGALQGTLQEVGPHVLWATLPGARQGQAVRVARGDGTLLWGEVYQVVGERAALVPFSDTRGCQVGAAVTAGAVVRALQVGPQLFGRVVDGLGRPIDDGPSLGGELWDAVRPPPPSLARATIDTVLATGVRAIDGVATLGRGQRIGLFAAAGVGKSTLLAQIARGAAADVIVSCLVGERGREVKDFIAHTASQTQTPAIAVVATADEAPLMRIAAVHTATAIAEYFRHLGKHVLLVVDSLTRVARAQRDLGLALGEPAGRHGYPASVFTLLPQLVERAGTARTGSITGIYTVLVASDDLDEPIADELRGVLDGHLILDRKLAARGHYPPLDIVKSNSRVALAITSAAHQQAASKLRARRAIHEEHADLITLGGYQRGHNPALDAAVAAAARDLAYLQQRHDAPATWAATVEGLLTL